MQSSAAYDSNSRLGSFHYLLRESAFEKPELVSVQVEELCRFETVFVRWRRREHHSPRNEFLAGFIEIVCGETYSGVAGLDGGKSSAKMQHNAVSLHIGANQNNMAPLQYYLETELFNIPLFCNLCVRYHHSNIRVPVYHCDQKE